MKKHKYIENINTAQLEHYCIVLKEEYFERTARRVYKLEF